MSEGPDALPGAVDVASALADWPRVFALRRLRFSRKAAADRARASSDRTGGRWVGLGFRSSAMDHSKRRWR